MTGSRLIFVLWMMLMMCGHQVQSGFPHQVQPEERALAIRLFDEGKFPEALPHFSKLCYNFPYDFQLKYYFGACLVETGNFGTDAEKNLVLASSSDVPARVNFYLGKLYHGQGNWNSAQRYYNRFRNNSAPAEIAELNVDDLISLCFREINPFHPSPSQLARNAPDSVQIDTPADTLFTVIQPDASEKLLPDSLQKSWQQVSGQALADTVFMPETGGKDSLRVDTLAGHNGATGSDTISASVPLLPEIIELPPFIEFQINDRVTYLVEDMFRVPEAKNEFRMAQDKERQLDSLLAEVQHLRKQYHQSVKPTLRDSLATRIQNLEYRNLVLNTETSQHFYKSRKLEQEWWDKNGFEQLEEYQNWKDSLLDLSKRVAAQVQEELQDTVRTPEVLLDAANPESEIKEEVTEVDEVKDVIFYRVQIGASDKGIPAQRRLQFDKLSKIRTIETMQLDNGMTIYTTGNLRNFGDAMKLQSQVRMEGIKDAFVIAVKNGKRINLPRE